MQTSEGSVRTCTGKNVLFPHDQFKCPCFCWCRNYSREWLVLTRNITSQAFTESTLAKSPQHEMNTHTNSPGYLFSHLYSKSAFCDFSDQ